MAAPFDFDAHPVRWGSNSLKWSATAQIRDAEWPPMAMGASDMDFRAPAVAVEAGMRLLRDGALGYRADTGSFRRAVANWMAERHDWHVDPEAVLPVCGTLNGAALALDTLTDPGAGVLIFEPVYGYFRILIEGMRRVPVAIRLSETDGRYRLPDTLESLGLPDGVQAICGLRRTRTGCHARPSTARCCPCPSTHRVLLVSVMKWFPASCPILEAKGYPAIGQQDLRLADPAGVEDDLPGGGKARVVLVAHAEIRIAERDPDAFAGPADMHDLARERHHLRKAAQVRGAFSSSSLASKVKSPAVILSAVMGQVLSGGVYQSAPSRRRRADRPP
jgi:hypothetical protein